MESALMERICRMELQVLKILEVDRFSFMEIQYVYERVML